MSPARLAASALLLLLASASPAPLQAAIPPASAIDATSTNKVTLRYKFSKGQTLRFTTDARQTISAVGSSTSLSESRVTLPSLFEVQEVTAAGGAQMTLAIRSPSITLTSNGQPVNVSNLVKSISSAQAERSLLAEGTIVNPTPVGERDATTSEAAAFVNDLLAMQWPEFPSEPMSIGTQWLQTIPMAVTDDTGRVDATANLRYTLKGFAKANRNIAVIGVVYETEANGSVPTRGSNSTSALVSRGRGEGFLLFDMQAGLVTETEYRLGIVNVVVNPVGARTTLTVNSTARTTRTR
jgi:hypothetical protein